MRLNCRTWGGGDRVAALVHGGGTDSGTWHRIGPALADKGFHVVAVDLRGHGGSPRGYYTPAALAADLVDTLPATPELAVGHCLGAAILTLAVPRLRPRREVYVEPYWSVAGSPIPLSRSAFADLAETDPALLAARHPRWTPADIEAETAARARWDVRVSIDLHRFDMPEPPPLADGGTLVVLADTEEPVVSVDRAALRAIGFEVRDVPDTGHAVHHDNPAAFLAVMESFAN